MQSNNPRLRDASATQPITLPQEKSHAKHGFLSFILWLVMIVVVCFLALRFLPVELATGRAIPELASFIPLMIIPTLVCLVLAICWRRWALLVLCAACLVLNGAWHIGYFVPTNRVSDVATRAVAASADVDDAYARIMTLNTANGNAIAEEIVDLCKEENVEILCLQELSSQMVVDLQNAGINEVLPYSLISDAAISVSNGGRNGIWTAAPMDNESTNLLTIETSSMPAGTVQIGDAFVRIVSVHPNSPVRGAQDLWDAGLSTIGTLSEYNHAYLIMGDFNSTWDHARFRELLGSTFLDASESSGEGFHMTYPANLAIPSLIEIDHIVYSKDSGIVVSSLETKTISGTDHKALLATLEAS